MQGARITEASLAEELNVSRIPLRAAIPQLRIGGFVTTLPRRGAVVFEWTPQAVNDLFDARLAIEVAAAGYAARSVGSGTGTIQPLLDIIDESHRAVEEGDSYGIAEVSARFHARIVELAGNDLLTSAMRAVEGRLTWLFYLTSTRDTHLAGTEHDELCRAILAGNVELARALAYAHIESGREPTFQAMMLQHEEPGAQDARLARRRASR
jgi:DNA-binding GntR family transcriptional regulator